eukprot:884930-Rhodomonas_salina.5
MPPLPDSPPSPPSGHVPRICTGHTSLLFVLVTSHHTAKSNPIACVSSTLCTEKAFDPGRQRGVQSRVVFSSLLWHVSRRPRYQPTVMLRRARY